MKYLLFSLFALSSLLISCKSSENATKVKGDAVTEQWIIANAKVPCDETQETLCYQVKRQGSFDYELMDVVIENFNYEENYKYQIEVNIITSKKGETTYVLSKELFKVQHN